jgi:hypothetical protein
MTATEIVLDQVRLQIAEQFKRLDDFRTKAFAGFAVSGGLAAFFGARVARAPLAVAALSIAAFAMTAAVALAVARPIKVAHGLELHDSVKDGKPVQGWGPWLAANGSHPDADELAVKSATEALLDVHAKNGPRVNGVAKLFRWECRLLAVQVVLWLIALTLSR